MNEQWNNALDQVEDEFLMETARYRRKRYWPGVAAAAAAVLVLAVGWSVFKTQTPSQIPDSNPDKGAVMPTEHSDILAPGSAAPEYGLGDWLLGGSDSTEQTPTIDVPTEEPPYYETLHYGTYEEFQSACLDRRKWYLHRDVMIPCLNGQPLEIEDISVFEAEMYNEPWVWYFISHAPHITVRVPTMPSLTANIDPSTSGAEALRQIWPEAPNLHNREEYTDSYSEIREVQITTSEGVKNALLRRETGRDRVYLTFLQNGTLVTVAGPANALEGDWLERFILIPVNSL